jgi:hypothetical protein
VRYRQCERCGVEHTTYEIRGDTAQGAHNAKKALIRAMQGSEVPELIAAASVGYTPFKNLHTLRMEEHATSPEFVGLLETQEKFNAYDVAKRIPLGADAVAKRLRLLEKLGVIERCSRGKYGSIEYRMASCKETKSLRRSPKTA